MLGMRLAQDSAMMALPITKRRREYSKEWPDLSNEPAFPMMPDRANGVFGTKIGSQEGQNLPHSTSGSDRRRKPSGAGGFTLIELMIVATLLGILASIALASFNGVKERAYIATVKSDLKNIAYAQELYFTNNYTYAQATPLLREYSPSPDVTLIMVASADGWRAKGTHKANANVQCAVFHGEVRVSWAPATVEGSIACVPKSGGGLGGGGGQGGGQGGGRPGGASP